MEGCSLKKALLTFSNFDERGSEPGVKEGGLRASEYIIHFP
jgi:hypothetical protein